jgi:hypothetical protein
MRNPEEKQERAKDDNHLERHPDIRDAPLARAQRLAQPTVNRRLVSRQETRLLFDEQPSHVQASDKRRDFTRRGSGS